MPNNYKYITTAATTLLAGNDISRILVKGICVNKTLTGTLTVKSGGGSGTTIGVFAIGTTPNTYWLSTGGMLIDNPALINSATDDITVIYSNAN